MPHIVISDRAHEMLQRYANMELGGVARRLAGSLEVEIAARLHDELMTQQFPGETISQTILRVLPARTGGRR